LIIYLFGNTNCSYSLKDVTFDNKILVIDYNYKINYTTEPERAFIIIKIDKIEYEEIIFI